MEIDRLEIEIQAQATKASAELDKLIGKLNILSGSLSSVQASGLSNLASGITQLSVSMQMIGNSKTSSFTKLANNIQKLGNINTGNMQSIATSINAFSSSINSIGVTGSNSQQISDLVNAVSKFGNVSMQRVATNLPLLANALKNFMVTLSTAPNVSSNIINLTSAMANLAQFGSKYNATINSVTRASNTLTKANSNVVYSTKSMASSMALKFSKLLATVYALRRAFNFLGGSIEKSMNFTETVNLFQTSFKKIGMEAAQTAGLEWGSEAANQFAIGFIQEAQDFNDMLVDMLSLDPNTLMNYQAVFAQIANGFGLTDESVMNLSKSFTMLGLDIASLFNTDIETAMIKLRAGLAGETEPLRALGVDITETTLKMTALKYGINDSTKNMSQAAKTQLRYLAIMDQTSVAFGDMAKTIDSPVNQLRVLQQQWNNLSRSIGNVFMPVIATVLPYVNALVIALRRMIDALAKAVGFELPDYSNQSIYSGISSSIGDIGDAAENSKKSVNKLKKALLGIDELNILSSGTAPNLSGGGVGIGAGGGYDNLDDIINDQTKSYLAKFNKELSGMSHTAEEAADKIVKFFEEVGGAVEPTFKALEELNRKLAPFKKFVAQGLIDFYNKFLVPVGKWTFGEGTPTLIESLEKLLGDVDWDDLSKSLGGLFESLGKFTIGIGKGLVTFISDLSGVLSPAIGTTLEGLSRGLSLFADALDNLSPETVERLGSGLGTLFTSLALLKGMDWIGKTLTTIGSGLSGMSGGLVSLASLNGFSISIIFGDFVKELDEWVTTKLANKFGELWKDVFVLLANAGYSALAGFTLGGLPGAVIGAIVGGLLAAVTSLDMRQFWESVKSESIRALKAVFNWDATQKMFVDMMESFKRALNGEDIGANLIKGLLKGVEGTLSFILEPINDLFWEIVREVKELFGIHSPSTVFADIGKNLVLGLHKGLKDNWGSFISYVAGLPQKMIDALGNMSTKFSPKGKEMLEGIRVGWNNTWESFVRWIGAKPFSISTSFGSISDKFVGKGKDIISGIKKGWNDNWSDFKTWLSNIPSKISAGIGKLYNVGKSIISDFVKGFKSMSLPRIRIDVTYESSGILGKVGQALGLAGFPKLNLGFYATGGYPEVGELFIANEAGPELVGRIGGKTAVANNVQIEAGIEEAAYRGYMRAIMESGSGRGVSQEKIVVESNLYVDSEKMYSIYQKGKAKAGRRFQTTP